MESIQDSQQGWRVLRNCVLPGPGQCVLTLVALHPRFGVALVDTLPKVTPDAVPRLHFRLQQGQFSSIYGLALPPILHLALHPYELFGLEAIFAEAFQGRPAPQLPGGDAWLDTTARLLLTEAPLVVPRQSLTARMSVGSGSLTPSARYAISTAFVLAGLAVAWIGFGGGGQRRPVSPEMASVGGSPTSPTLPALEPLPIPPMLRAAPMPRQTEASPAAVAAKATPSVPPALPMIMEFEPNRPAVVAEASLPMLPQSQPMSPVDNGATMPFETVGLRPPAGLVSRLLVPGETPTWPADAQVAQDLPVPPAEQPPNPTQAWPDVPVILALSLPPDPLPPLALPPAASSRLTARTVGPVAVAALPPPVKTQAGSSAVRLDPGCRLLVQRIQTGEEASEDELLRLLACRKGG